MTPRQAAAGPCGSCRAGHQNCWRLPSKPIWDGLLTLANSVALRPEPPGCMVVQWWPKQDKYHTSFKKGTPTRASRLLVTGQLSSDNRAGTAFCSRCRPPGGSRWAVQARRQGGHALKLVWGADLAIDQLITAGFRASQVAQLPLLDDHGALLPKAGPTPAGRHC